MTSRITAEMLHYSTIAAAETAMSRRAGEKAMIAPAVVVPAGELSFELPAPLPAADDLHIPEHYEARYAYPLIVWLSSAEKPQCQLSPLMRRISDRNSFGVAVRTRPGEPVEDRIFETVLGLRRKYHLHSERIYVAGVGDDAVRALKTSFARPEWFAGVVALSAEFPRAQRWLSHFDALRGKRVFLGTGRDDESKFESTLRLQRLLWSGGLSVRAFSYDFRDQIDDGLLREIDRWMMQAIEETAAAA
jgi:phospholipase/carboxylesterase